MCALETCVYELCMIQRNAAALIPARIIFCVGEGEGELIDTPIDCSLTLFINESPTQINRHVNIPCSKKDVCVRIFLVLKKAPTNINMELQQLLFEFAKPSTNQID